MRRNVERGLPFDDGSVEAVYSSHMLEHLPRNVALGVLRECRRVLGSNGVLRLAVPDLRQMAEDYLRSSDAGAADAFMRGSGLGVERRVRGLGRLIEIMGGSKHKWLYDAKSLQQICVEAGFLATRVCSYREGSCPGLEDVEQRPESLFVEALLQAN